MDQLVKESSRIFNIINEAPDLLNVLDEVLLQLVELTGSGAAWIFLRNGTEEQTLKGSGFYLAGQYSSLPQIDLHDAEFWKNGCNCQDLISSSECGIMPVDLACARFMQINGVQKGVELHTALPLCSGKHLFGILNIVGARGELLDRQELDIVQSAAAHLSTALDRRRLSASIKEKRAHEQIALWKLSNQLAGFTELEDILAFLAEKIAKLFEVDACALLLPDKQSGNLAFVAAAGWLSDPVAAQRRVLNNDQTGSGRVMRTQVPLLSTCRAERGDIPEMTLAWLEEEDFEGVAIVPLIVEGKSIGTLVLTTRTQWNFDEDEIRLLQILANQTGNSIVNARRQKEEIRLQRLDKELSIGRDIQQSLLPASSPVVTGWDFSDIYRPARQVAGDLYDYFQLPYARQRLGIVIGDVADKGVPAALFMAAARTLIRSVALAGLTPASTLMEANKLIQQDSASDIFLSAFYTILDTENGHLNFANAGHEPPLWFQHTTGSFQELRARGMLLSIQKEIRLEEKSVVLDHGDILVLYTDGIPEAIDEHYNEFGRERLQDIVAAHAQDSATEICQAIVEGLDAFCGHMDQMDDLTLIVARRL